MNKDYRYQLENRKLTAKRVLKYTCPGCGRRKCFVRYIDTRNNNQYVADRCSSPPPSTTTSRHAWRAMHPTPTWQTSSWAKPIRRRSKHET